MTSTTQEHNISTVRSWPSQAQYQSTFKLGFGIVPPYQIQMRKISASSQT
jgi:hypothetical protein